MPTSGYIDYSSTYKNDSTNKIDYSSYIASSITLTPPYRFSTFCWNASTDLSSKVTNSFNFTIYNFSVSGEAVSQNNLIQDSSGCVCYSSDNGLTLDNRLLIHYRVEDATIIDPSINSASTVWVDGNSNFSSDSNGFIPHDIDNAQISSSIYYQTSTNDLVKFTGSRSYTMIGNNKLQINLNNLLYKRSNASIIYFRIGLPTSKHYSFSNVSLSILPNNI